MTTIATGRLVSAPTTSSMKIVRRDQTSPQAQPRTCDLGPNRRELAIDGSWAFRGDSLTPLDWSIDEIAIALDCPPGTVKSHAHAAARRLAVLLAEPAALPSGPAQGVTP